MQTIFSLYFYVIAHYVTAAPSYTSDIKDWFIPPAAPQSPRYWNTMEKLASGSFGSVYRGIDSLTGLEVAIKIPIIKDPDSVHQLRNEINLLQGPFKDSRQTTVSLIEVINPTTDGQFAFPITIMERLGQTVNDLVDTGYLAKDPVTRCHVFRMMVEAVANVHKKGYCHKDIKPENFMTTLNLFDPPKTHTTFKENTGYYVDGAKLNKAQSYYGVHQLISGHAKSVFHVVLIDFGMVTDAWSSALTGWNRILTHNGGTPIFMAHEALTNQPHDCQKSDVYSL
jgi:serine/threonine protein kinase